MQNANSEPPTPLTVLRVAVLLHLAVLLWQGLTAGGLVTPPIDAGALYLHYVGAFGLHAIAVVQVAAAAWLWWRPGRVRTATGLLLVLSALALVLGFVQAALGAYLVMLLHVPLSLVLVGLVAWTAVLSWRR